MTRVFNIRTVVERIKPAISVSVCIAHIAKVVAVKVALIPVGIGWAIIIGIANTVAISVYDVFTRVSNGIFVVIDLVAITQIRAIIDISTNAILVNVILGVLRTCIARVTETIQVYVRLVVLNAWAVIAEGASTISVIIGKVTLIKLRGSRAVVATVTSTVFIGISLLCVSDVYAVVTCIANAIEVGVGLVFILYARTVVNTVDDAVIVSVGAFGWVTDSSECRLTVGEVIDGVNT